jgi:26S proteasome regulatory subunit N2
MTNDPVNYVRQGALVASALILIQQNEVTCPKVKDFRQMYAKVISDKHDDVMAKFGAILAQGIIDAGGRNTTISLQSRTGHTEMSSVVGMLVFTQFWFWYPLAHFLALCFTPTCLIGLNADLKMPKLEFRSNAKPSMFAYPPPLEEKKEKEREKVTTAVLSITAKAKRKEQEKNKDKMDVDEEKEKPKEKEKPDEGTKDKVKTEAKDGAKQETKDGAKQEAKETKEKEAKEKEPEKPEPNFEILSNPARTMRQQLKVIQSTDGTRYTPLKDVTIGGIIILKDSKADEPEDLVENLPTGGPKVEEEDEPEPPEPFEYIED